MSDEASEARITLSQIGDAMLACVQAELRPSVVRQMQSRLLERISGRAVRKVMLDLSEVRFMDLESYQALIDMKRTISLMGAATVLVGLRPGVIQGLSQVGADLGAFRGAISLEQALALKL
ncbi:STAS domain-containing protein [Chromobacterium sp. IIBBL 290-4]|uniref:STAS domain-containing protein n=1 Tax=Chromobacterium sp. IIBBL 290-4 TaxID=2953890 RepID=UPI0020B7C6F3|nr:STAS domain-containing protein [Chromobacterium sp. IIBBL 290-4]UTH75237.1 STAS domain-containing protein [Chromobacterium sp. IIBBL 290-4]